MTPAQQQLERMGPLLGVSGPPPDVGNLEESPLMARVLGDAERFAEGHLLDNLERLFAASDWGNLLKLLGWRLGLRGAGIAREAGIAPRTVQAWVGSGRPPEGVPLLKLRRWVRGTLDDLRNRSTS